jgi:hypothetical protein
VSNGSFVQRLVLAEPRSHPPESVHGASQAYVAAASVVSFNRALSPGDEADVLDSTLLAQLAANGGADREGDLPRWYEAYTNVLTNVAWAMQPLVFHACRAGSASMTMDEVARRLLGDAASSSEAKAACAALQALTSADGGQPLALFEHSASLSTGGAFQLHVVSVVNGGVQMILGALYFTTSAPAQSVLTAPLPASGTTINTAVRTATFDRDAYAVIRATVREKLGSYAESYVASINL